MEQDRNAIYEKFFRRHGPSPETVIQNTFGIPTESISERVLLSPGWVPERLFPADEIRELCAVSPSVRISYLGSLSQRCELHIYQNWFWRTGQSGCGISAWIDRLQNNHFYIFGRQSVLRNGCRRFVPAGICPQRGRRGPLPFRGYRLRFLWKRMPAGRRRRNS